MGSALWEGTFGPDFSASRTCQQTDAGPGEGRRGWIPGFWLWQLGEHSTFIWKKAAEEGSSLDANLELWFGLELLEHPEDVLGEQLPKPLSWKSLLRSHQP